MAVRYAGRDWKAVDRLQEKIRDYRAAGAIGSFEIRIRTNEHHLGQTDLFGEAGLDTVVTAEILDALKLAELRGLRAPGPVPMGEYHIAGGMAPGSCRGSVCASRSIPARWSPSRP